MYIIPYTQNLVNNFRESGHHKKKAPIPNTKPLPPSASHSTIFVNELKEL